MNPLLPAWRRLGSVRLRLTLLATALVAIALIVSGVWLVTVQERLLTQGIDESLSQRADNISGEIAAGGFGTQLPSEGDPEDSFLQLLDANGRVIAASSNVSALAAVTSPIASGSNDVFSTVPSIPVSDSAFRLLTQTVHSSHGNTTLVVAKNLDDVQESVAILTKSLTRSIPIGLLLLAIVVWWLTGRVLAPVEGIRAEVSSIEGAVLHRRVPVPETNDEIARLARTMNEMLERIEKATDQQRQFVADASHELRSPLARIRATLEVGMHHPSTTDAQIAYRELLSDASQLQQLLDDLLFLARSESSALDRPDTVVDLDDLVLEHSRLMKIRARVHVDTSGVGAARVQGDPRQLTRAIHNLANNAERHSATTVYFEVGEAEGISTIVVADDGPGIPVEQREAVFERFARLDEARSRDDGGSGLGLAIVRDIAIRHGGCVRVEARNGGGARFVLTVPSRD